MNEAPEGAYPNVGQRVRVHTKTGDVVSGRVMFARPDRFAVVNPSGTFWVRPSGWGQLDFLDLLPPPPKT